MTRPISGRVFTLGTRAGFNSAFTLVELLTVIGLISLLVGMLLPTLASASRNAKALQCQNNVRQLCLALTLYANGNKGRLPPNQSTPTGRLWTDPDKVGTLTPTEVDLRGPVATCPEDGDARRSYSMNIWASSAIDASTRAQNSDQPWTLATKCGERLILVTEKWSWSGTQGNWVTPSPPVVGAIKATPAQRFGGGTGLSPALVAGRFGQVNSELPFQRHRSSRSTGTGTQPVGRVVIGYADCHVAMVSNVDLVNHTTGLSTLQSMWSPADPQLNK